MATNAIAIEFMKTTPLKIQAIVLVTITALISGSCAKKQQPKPATGPDAKTLALTSGPWKLSKWEAKHKDGSWLALILTNNQKIARTTYKTDHTYVTGTEQNGTISTLGSGNWRFDLNEMAIITSNPSEPGVTDSINYPVITATELQSQEFDFHLDLTQDLTGSATDTAFYGLRYTYTH